MGHNEKSYTKGGLQKKNYSTEDVENCKCPLCGKNDSNFIYSERGSLKIVKCKSCDLIYVNPRVKQAEKNYWGNEEIYFEEAKFIFSGKKKHHRDRNYEYEIKKIKQFKSSGELLDIGSSMGFFLRKARDAGFKVQGVEPSPSLSKIAVEQFKLEILNQYLEKAALPEKKFDIITMIDVFEHVTNPRELLTHAKKILRDDGIICIKVPNGNYNLLKLKLAKFSGRETKHDIFDSYEHVVHYTKKTMLQTLDHSGLKIEKIIIPIPIHPPVWAQRTGHYFQYPSPFAHDWKRIILRNLFYLIGKVEHFGRMKTNFAPDLMFIVRKK